VDGLSGFPDAINAVFSKAEVQLCMRTLVRVRMVLNSVKYVPYKDRKAVTADLKPRQKTPQVTRRGVLPGNGIANILPFPNHGGTGGCEP
jgi:transposase-like protein